MPFYRTLLIEHVTVLLALTVAIATYHYSMLRKHKGTRFNEPISSKILTSLLFIFGTMHVILSFCKEFAISKTMCFIASKDAESYLAFKCVLYLILVSRVHFTYKATPKYRYNTYKLLSWAVFNVTWSCAMILCAVLLKQISYSPTHHIAALRCTSLVPVPTVHVFVILQDFVNGIVYICLFCRPLVRMRGGDDSRDFKKLTLKIFVLSTIAILSTIIAMICVALFNRAPLYLSPVLLSGTDVLISEISVILS